MDQQQKESVFLHVLDFIVEKNLGGSIEVRLQSRVLHRNLLTLVIITSLVGHIYVLSSFSRSSLSSPLVKMFSTLFFPPGENSRPGHRSHSGDHHLQPAELAVALWDVTASGALQGPL
jgi:hypothetical protein